MPSVRASSSVWRRITDTGRVAEFMAKRKLRSDDAVARFRREAQLLSERNNLNIVRTFGHGVTEENTPTW